MKEAQKKRQANIGMTAQPRRDLQVRAFFDPITFTVSYVVSDPITSAAAIIDPVLDYDPASGRTGTTSADTIINHVRAYGLTVQWILETHVHADHLTASQHLKQALGGRIAIGADVRLVQKTFATLFNAGPVFKTDGSQFDITFHDGERFAVGSIEAMVLAVPGHTPACVAYVVGDAAFVGDTLFMPDYGTARCDFPGGDARQLYRSIMRILALPDQMRLFMCHDYKAPGRDQYRWETTVAEQRRSNIHIHDDVGEDQFVAMRTARDVTLTTPQLLLPAVQINMCAGALPPPEDNGTRYLKIPLNALLSS